MFASLRKALLKDLSREHFVILFARGEIASNGREVHVVEDIWQTGIKDLDNASLCQVRPKKEFIAMALQRVQNDLRLNAIIDAHTHPFAACAAFSCIDDADECQFSHWLSDIDPEIGYGSIVLSQKAWAARIWHEGMAMDALVKNADLA